MNKKAHMILAVLGVSVAAAVATHARAEEQSYYKGSTWEVLSKTSDTEDKTASCVLRSVNWAAKSVAIEYDLVGIDEVMPRLRVIKQQWNLPVNQTTKVRIGARGAGTVVFDAKVLNGNELYGEIPAPHASELASMVDNMVKVMTKPIKPASFIVYFDGDEPIWVVPAVDFGEAVAFSSELKNCLTELTRLGPSIFKSAEPSTTSPFAKSSGQSGLNFGSAPNNNVDTSRPSTDQNANIQDFLAQSDGPAQTAKSSWTFAKREEDWGDTCYVETKQGDILVGFMGAPGEALAGFVENGFTGNVTTTWKIDGARSYVADGDVADYSGWHEFYGLPKDILTDAKDGKQLTISDKGGETITTISLASASKPFEQFIGCINKRSP
ncbi:hypothetical protein [Agrobacterium larrymoorei]|uniref:Uncharacterized protein n=1 Tax=Agrobacterium larrymoorei TaxID=160699 RepID=A0A4D7DQC7_9HYPH|nr:hypothetical protein [Agrobacterium larrymoorei]QCI98841.1 hypothetical protein CFBP5473_13615 [Agrobacterium larrymoorei]QYA08271.1 hypothetical protein J5285_06120 [Agrobacterium larrymoorei]